MDRKNFFYRQLVTEAEIDAAFTDVDNGFKNLLVDQGLSGVLSGFTPSAPSVAPYQVTLSSGVAYSKTLGRRLNYTGGIVSLATNELGNPVTLPVSNGDIRIVSIFLEPVYTETDPRTDGYGNPVNFVRTESLTVRVVASAFGVALTVPPPPALRSDQILIADVVTYRDSGVNYIFVVTAEPVVTTSVSPAGTFTVNPRTEYLMPVLAGDYLGDGVTLGWKIRDAVSNLALKLKGYQTANTLSSLAVSPANSADVNHPASHDAFSSGGTFDDKPGFYLLKKIAGVSTYEPTVDVVFSPDQEVSGGSPGSANHVIDLDANSVDLNLITEGRFSLKNLTVKGITSSYKVTTSAGPNAVELENVTLDPITPGNKLFFNVHNANASRFRKNFGLSLKGVDSGSSNLVFGARVDASGLPITNVEDLVSGNLTIDGHGGYYRNIRLEGTDTTIPVLNITGDNNIIENLVVASPLGDAPMISISGRNNIIRNVYLHNFGATLAGRSNFKALDFTPSSVNNSVEALYIQGGSNAFTGSGTDLNDGTKWDPISGATITDLMEDPAGQPLADTVSFTNSGSAVQTDPSFLAPIGPCIIEVWAKGLIGGEVFKLKSGGVVPANFIATTGWQKFRQVIASGTAQTVILNGNATAKSITFAHPARYTLTNLGDVNLVVLAGTNNQIDGLRIENIQNNNAPIILWQAFPNKVSNVVFDGVFAPSVQILSGSINIENFSIANFEGSTPQFLIWGTGSCHFKNVDLNLANPAYRIANSPNTILMYLTEGTATDNIILDNVRLVDNPVSSPNVPVLSLLGCFSKVYFSKVYVKTKYGDNPNGTALSLEDVPSFTASNCEFIAEYGGSVNLVNAFGKFDTCTFRGGDGNPGANIKLFDRIATTYERSLTLQNITMVYGASNRGNSTSANIIRMYADNLIVDGLKIYSDTIGISLSTLLKIEHHNAATTGILRNVDFYYKGSLTNVALEVQDFLGKNLTLENISISGWKINDNDIVNSLVKIANATVRGLTIDGDSIPGNGRIDSILTQINSSIYNLRLFPTQAIPTKVTIVNMVDDNLADDNINRIDDLYLNYGLTTDPVENMVRMGKGSQHLSNSTIITEALCLDTTVGHSAVILMDIGNDISTKYIPSTVTKVKVVYDTALTSALIRPDISPNNQPWQLKVISSGISQRHIITDNTFVFSCPADSHIVNVTSTNVFSNNILRNVDSNAIALLRYLKTVYLTNPVTSEFYPIVTDFSFKTPMADVGIVFPLPLDTDDTIISITALVRQRTAGISGQMYMSLERLIPQNNTSSVGATVGGPIKFLEGVGYKQGSITSLYKATGTLKLTNNVSNGDTVTTGSKTYTFQTSLTNVNGNVLIGATASDSLDNLIAAINLGSGVGTLYAAATTANGFVQASFDVFGNMGVTALIPGSTGTTISTTETSSVARWESANLVYARVDNSLLYNVSIYSSSASALNLEDEVIWVKVDYNAVGTNLLSS